MQTHMDINNSNQQRRHLPIGRQTQKTIKMKDPSNPQTKEVPSYLSIKTKTVNHVD